MMSAISIRSLLRFVFSARAVLCRTGSRGTRPRRRSPSFPPSAARRDANRNRAGWIPRALSATGSCDTAEWPPSVAPATLRVFRLLRVWRLVSWNRRTCPDLACAECDDAADWIVGRNPDGHAVAWNNLDTKTAHTAAQLREHLMPGIALNAVETSAMYCHHRSLHVY